MSQFISITEHFDRDTIGALIDAEPCRSTDSEVQRHLGLCHMCTLRILAATELKQAVFRAGRRFVPTPALAARIRSQLEPSAARASRQLRLRAWKWGGFPVAAGLVLSVSLGWHHFRQEEALAAELLDQHLATLSSSAQPQVISSDRHTVKPWFQGRLPFSFNLPEAAALPPETILKGADLTYLNGQPAALLLFSVRKHEVSVTLTQRTAQYGSLRPFSRAGYSIRSAATGDLNLIAVSDADSLELDHILDVLVTAQDDSRA